MVDLQGVVQGICPITSPASGAVVGPIQSANVIVQQVEERLQLPANCWPAVILTNQGMTEEENEAGSTFEDDAVIYPVAVVVVDRHRPNYQAARADYLYFRRTIQNKLRGLVNPPLLLNTPEVSDIRLENLQAIPAEIAELDTPAMGFVARCFAWEARTRGGDGA